VTKMLFLIMVATLMLYFRTLTIYSIYNKRSESLTFYTAFFPPISVPGTFVVFVCLQEGICNFGNCVLVPNLKIFVGIVHSQEAKTSISKSVYKILNKLNPLPLLRFGKIFQILFSNMR
jgi:hypothetical protein